MAPVGFFFLRKLASRNPLIVFCDRTGPGLGGH